MCNVSPDYGHKDFHVCMLEDVEKIPTDIEKLFYHSGKIYAICVCVCRKIIHIRLIFWKIRK